MDQQQFDELRGALGSLPVAVGKLLDGRRWAWKQESVAHGDVRIVSLDHARSLLALAAQNLTISADHLFALNRVLTDQVTTFAPWTVSRSSIENAATVVWLLSPGSSKARLGRKLALRLRNLQDMRKWLRSNDNVQAESMILITNKRIADVEQQASEHGLEIRRGRDNRIIGFPEAVPNNTMLADHVGLGSHYRVLSGVAHGRLWATSATGFKLLPDREGLTQDLSPDAATTIMIESLRVWLMAAHAIYVFCGWDLEELAEVADPVLDRIGLNSSVRPWR